MDAARGFSGLFQRNLFRMGPAAPSGHAVPDNVTMGIEDYAADGRVHAGQALIETGERKRPPHHALVAPFAHGRSGSAWARSASR